MVDLEQIDIEELSQHTADELLEEVLPVAETKYSYDDFYRRWEQQHWLATGIDFTKDRDQWRELPEVLRRQLVNTFSAFYQGEESVTRNLAPLLAAAPRIDHEIFLTTQTVDEARHLVFFRRVFNEVVEMDGDTSEHLERFRPYHGRWYSNLFFGPDGLDGRAAALTADIGNIAKFAEMVTLYHLVIETGLALTGQRFLLDLCREKNILPGFYKGFMAVTRDESRHVGFGVRVIRELCANDPSLGDAVLKVMRHSIPDVVRLLHPPDIDYDPAIVETIPTEVFIAPQESHRYSFTHILKRLSAAGFPSDRVNGLGALAWSEFESSLGEWEARTGGKHFARLYPEAHAVGPARVA